MSAMSSSMAARVAFAPAASRVASKSGKKQRAAARRAGRTARGAHRGLVVRASDLDDELVPLNFDDKTVDDFLPIIVEYTGKAVITATTIPTTKISIRSDRMVSKHEALNLIFQAFRLNNIGVVETADMVMIGQLSSELRNMQPGLILGPEVDVTSMPEDGQVVTKVFRLEHAKAGEISEQIASQP